MNHNVFNEDTYLYGPDILIYAFYKKYQSRLEKYQEEQKEYHNIMQNYDLFITELASFIKDMGFQSSLEISVALAYIIRNGYASHDKYFRDAVPDPETELTSKHGLSIIRGLGCCRNYSAMHYEVMQALNMFVSSFFCYQGFELFKKPKNQPANHVINLIEYNGNLYGIDLYNYSKLYHFKKAFVLREISYSTSTELRYKPYYKILMYGTSKSELLKEIEYFHECSQKSIINPFTYHDEIKFETENFLQAHTSDLDDFHNQTKSLKKEIIEELLPKIY